MSRKTEYPEGEEICSFCGRSLEEVANMLVTEYACICNECAETVHEAFEKSNSGNKMGKNDKTVKPNKGDMH